MQNPHSSIDALVIHCIDYRFVSKTADFLHSLKDNYDLIAYPGASKDMDQLIQAVGISIRLHNPKKIILIDHEDCGAFGDQNSTEVHKASLEKAKALLEDKYPIIGVETYLATFEGVKNL